MPLRSPFRPLLRVICALLLGWLLGLPSNAQADVTVRNNGATCAAATFFYFPPTSLSISKPSGTQTGDLMIMTAWVAVGSGWSWDTSGPDGWTPLLNSGSTVSYYRIAAAGDSSWTVVTGGFSSGKASVSIVSFTGFDSSQPLASAGAIASGSDSSVELPNTTSDRSGSLRFSPIAAGSGVSATYSGGMSKVSGSECTTSSLGVSGGTESIGIGTTPSRTVSLSGSASWVGQTYVVRAPPSPPAITSVTPAAGPTAGGTSVTITGTDFVDLSGASAVKFGATNATSYTVNSPTQITAVAPAGTGTKDITVTTPLGTSANTAADDYTYWPAPAVSGLSPDYGRATGGTSVTITGTNFAGLSGASAVKFGATNATSYVVNSTTQITAVAPAGSGTKDVTVTAYGGTSSNTPADDYTYWGAPTVSSLSPSAGPTAGGTSVTITGTNFTDVTAVKFGASNATSYTVDSATQITAVAPSGSGTVNVAVTAVGGTNGNTAGDDYRYAPVPTVTGLSPTEGPATGGTSVTITGTGFTGATGVTFGGTAATDVTVVNATTITATAPSHAAGIADVRVTTPGGTSANTGADDFTYVAVPTVTAVSPAAGPTAGGQSITITGTNLTGASSVTVGGSAASSVVVVNATTVTATTPAHAAGTVDVRVTTSGGTSANTASDDYEYVALPTVSAVSPAQGPMAGGQSVTVTGTNLTGTTAVTFGGTNAASITVVNSTTITLTTPSHAAGTVDVRVTTPGGTSANTAADDYAYFAAPAISGMTPSGGTTVGGTSVTITGSDFTGTTSVTFGGTSASFTIDSATQITATAPPHASGTVDVRVTTPGGTSTNTSSDDYTYASPPAVTAISPDEGSTLGGTTVTVTGTNFTGTTDVTFGGAAASFTVDSATQLTVTTPAHAAGTVDVRVTNPDGTSANTANDDYTFVVPCSTGGLGVGVNDFALPAVTLNGADHTRTASTTVTVSDMTGTALGWKLAIGTTQFAASGGALLPTDAARIISANATPQAGACVAPTDAFNSYPVTLPISPSSTKVYAAAAGTGTGPVDIELGVALDIPASARAGTYQSTWTLDLTAAP